MSTLEVGPAPKEPDFRMLFEATPGLHLVLKPDAPRFTIVALSNAYARLTSTKREEIVGKGVFEVFPDDPAAPITTAMQDSSASFARVIATRAPDTMPVRRHDIRRPPEDGGGFEERWWSAVNSPVLGPDGELAYVLHRVDDITDLIRQRRAADEASQELSRREERLRDLFEGVPDGIFIASPDGRYTDVNPAGCRLLGYAREDLVGRSIVDFVPPEELLRQSELKRHIGEGGAEVSEWRLRRKDGTYVPVELSSNAMADGRLRAFVRDITTRHEAEARLRLSEAKFSGMISIAADAIISIDEAHRITLFNDGAEKIFGYAKAEVIGEPLDLLIPERYRAIHRRHLERFAGFRGSIARRMGEPNSMIAGLRKSGEEFPADAAISGIDIDGTRILTVALRDITVAQQAIRTRDEILGIVAHDLRSPLGAILMQASLLQRRGAEVDLGKAIERSARRMNRLIEDLLDVTRIEAGYFAIDRTHVAVLALIADAVEGQRAAATSASLELQVDAAKDLPDVWADRDRVLQIFENLIGNAIKFTADGGRITIGAIPRPGAVLFSVADTGRGIAEAELPHLFDRFWQAEKAGRRGVGLGLPIVKGIVQSHGGHIWVESTLGRGCTFFFTLPTAPVPGAYVSAVQPRGIALRDES